MPKRITEKEKFRRLSVASKLAMKYGSLHTGKVEMEQAREMSGVPDDSFLFFRNEKVPHIKWYIRNHFKVEDPIWDGDFIAGMTKVGEVIWNIKHFPTFRWWGAPMVAVAFQSCPYYGELVTGEDQKEFKRFHSWKKSPALYLSADKESKSYLAGLLATGKHHSSEGVNYAMYKDEVMEELARFGIQMEKRNYVNTKSLISPFWPALFTRYMPESIRSYWLDLKKPFMGEEYSSIFWLTYGSSNFVQRRGLPYLPSRRKILYKFKDEKGTIKELQKRRIKYNLVDLDKRLNDCILEWFN